MTRCCCAFGAITTDRIKGLSIAELQLPLEPVLMLRAHSQIQYLCFVLAIEVCSKSILNLSKREIGIKCVSHIAWTSAQWHIASTLINTNLCFNPMDWDSASYFAKWTLQIELLWIRSFFKQNLRPQLWDNCQTNQCRTLVKLGHENYWQKLSVPLFTKGLASINTINIRRYISLISTTEAFIRS